MCGIAGIISAKSPLPLTDAALSAMLQALRHRGPDDRGTFRSAGGHAALAHARLSILDLSPAGHQPMSTPDGRYTVVFNGEIYNFQELRREMVADGVGFQSKIGRAHV